MASALAVMRTREQIDALEVMAVTPEWWLVVPRMLGILLVMPALTTVSIALTVLSAWTVATFQLHLDGDAFLLLVRQSITGTDLVAGVVKAFVFGALICLVSCYHGLQSRRGPEGVGRATNLAVVISAVSVVVSNAIVSLVLYGR
jgi:phospholipid/cholesterol/gamma-HCH transport system permease protein